MTDAPSHQPVSVALALLDQRWPPAPAPSTIAGEQAQGRLDDDPRYLIGRLQQAINVLMAPGLAAADPLTTLLTQAITDAFAWRRHDDRPCLHCGNEMCPACSADWDQSDRYHELARALGAIGNRPRRSTTGSWPPSDQPPQLQYRAAETSVKGRGRAGRV